MKKIILFVLLITLCVSLCACGETKQPASSAANGNNAAAQEGSFNIRNGITWGMNKEQIDASEVNNKMSRQEGNLNAHWDCVLYYPAPVTAAYLFALQYMFKDGKLAAVIYDSGSDVAANEYTEIKAVMDEAYGAAAPANTEDVLKINEDMLPGRFSAANVVDGLSWQWNDEANIYMYKYSGEKFVILFADPSLLTQ